MKILLIGAGRSGKDTIAEILIKQCGLSHLSSSWVAAELFIYDSLKNKYGYSSVEDCFNDRHNHRAEWYNLICDYNKEDPTRLTKHILEKADIYVGLRSKDEVQASIDEKLFDVVVWVEREGCSESEDSMTVTKEYANTTIYNNGTLKDLERATLSFFNTWREYLDKKASGEA